jgi:hypothetical protein
VKISTTTTTTTTTTSTKITTTENHKITKPDKCVDQYQDCSHWPKYNFCNSVIFESDYEHPCRKSCGLCGSIDEYETVTKRCQDKNEKCLLWAKEKMCHLLDKYSVDVHPCIKSCKKCQQNDTESIQKTVTTAPLIEVDNNSSKCIDLYRDCTKWPDMDFCGQFNDTINIDHFHPCRKSCNLCEPAESVESKTATLSCADRGPVHHCQLWYKEKMCKRLDYLSADVHPCLKSCKMCQEDDKLDQNIEALLEININNQTNTTDIN